MVPATSMPRAGAGRGPSRQFAEMTTCQPLRRPEPGPWRPGAFAAVLVVTQPENRMTQNGNRVKLAGDSEQIRGRAIIVQRHVLAFTHGTGSYEGTVAVMEPVTIVIADDHTLFRQGTRTLLHTDPNLKVVGEGGTGDEVLELVQRHRPNIVLMDVEMPGPGPKSLIPRVVKISPDSAVIILTMHVGSGIVRELIECGAAAYLMKSITREELISAVRSVNGGPGNIILSVPRDTIKSFEQHERSALLSGRELEVLGLVSRALSNAQIAKRLHLSEGTVKRHLTNIYGKLGAVSRVDAINKAASAGMIAN